MSTQQSSEIVSLVDTLMQQFKIEHIDDGKQKHQSHECHIKTNFWDSMINGSLDLVGYGQDKEEAMLNLKQGFIKAISPQE